MFSFVYIYTEEITKLDFKFPVWIHVFMQSGATGYIYADCMLLLCAAGIKGKVVLQAYAASYHTTNGTLTYCPGWLHKGLLCSQMQLTIYIYIGCMLLLSAAIIKGKVVLLAYSINAVSLWYIDWLSWLAAQGLPLSDHIRYGYTVSICVRLIDSLHTAALCIS